MRYLILLRRYVDFTLARIFYPFTYVWGKIRQIIPGLKGLPTLKPETLAALLSLILILTIVITHAVIVFWFRRDVEATASYWRTLPVLVGLVVAIPAVMYFGVRIFLAPPKSPFPDIDLAFAAGIAALEKNGIAVRQTPIYLVLGMPDAKMVKHMMNASGRSFEFEHTTADGQALHWYGSGDHTYLFLTNVGNVCQLTRDLAKYVSQTSPDPDYAGGSDFKGTIDVRALGRGNKSPVAASFEDNVPDAQGDSESFRATIKAGELDRHKSPAGSSGSVREQPRSTTRSASQKQLSSREKLANQNQRMTHLCNLLRRHRHPVCAINGIVVAISRQLVEEFPGELARQIRGDLNGICQTSGVISTVTAIVTGFENDEGCREFVARLKETKGEGFLDRRFGKSYRSWECPTEGHLKEMSQESIENFDQYIYSLFTQHDALSSRHVTGNREMAKFLCWIYAKFFEGLEQTLTNGFSRDGGSDDVPRFAGCYFMGIGGSPDAQFFNEGVFDRIDENQGELEWNSRVLMREEMLSLMSQLTFLAGLIAIAAFVYLILR